MKKGLRYIIALFMLGSMGIVFLPLASFGEVRLSVFNIVRLGFAEDGDLGILDGVMEMAKSYIRNYSYMVLAWLILILIAAALTALLPTGAAYIVSMIGQITVNVIAIIFYVQIRDRIMSVSDAFESAKGFFDFGDLLGMEAEIKVHILPVLFWIGIYLVTLSLAVWGASMKEETAVKAGRRDILPENCQPGRNAYLARIHELERSGRRPDECADVRNPMQNPVQHAAIGSNMYSPAQSAAMGSNVQNPEQTAIGNNGQNPVCRDFHGAITGEKGIYASKTFLMEDRVPVYCCKEGRQMVVMCRQTGELAAEVYYVAEYGEYCVKPYRRLAVFLESGQPLGEGREYFLPRGMRIYLESRDYTFVLE